MCSDQVWPVLVQGFPLLILLLLLIRLFLPWLLRLPLVQIPSSHQYLQRLCFSLMEQTPLTLAESSCSQPKPQRTLGHILRGDDFRRDREILVEIASTAFCWSNLSQIERRSG